ncbi:MAG: 1-phosphofructokinase family hexose kinase [Deltaproteobacteria bacterium]|jgi:tagatose 6-phosphate kinase|nr:1-phosphofructokinase family hexose kinase [Deltaproteobacteria bacterium]
MITTVTLNASVDKRYSLERLEPGTVMRLTSCRETAGGKGLNVARVLKLLGAQVLATGLAGGRNGDFIECELTSLGICHDFVRIRGESRCCVNVIEAETGRQTEFLEPGPPVDGPAVDDFLGRFERAASRSSVVTISGSLPQGIPEGFYATLATLARRAGALSIVDAGGGSLESALRCGPDLVKPNLEEASSLLGRRLESERDAADAASACLDLGARIAVVSMGARGAVVAGPDALLKVSPPRVEARNAVGCGDSMVAGFARGLEGCWGLERSARFAVALSAASAMCEETGGFRAGDLESLLPLVEATGLH